MRTTLGMQNDALSVKTFSLAKRAVKLYQFLAKHKSEFILSKQAVRAGTSPGAMVRESKSAESTADFIHKLSVAQKEITEFCYWIDLLLDTDYTTKEEHASIFADSEEVYKLLTASIKTSKQKLKTQGNK
jgi:four helix bundle protein